ncbi:uncharacterized protein [Macrobrachium rosenbergii]|uniref:uncharacterized protein n=1 Tax=Macrobrachium rosenbergii TaxID=79674 RepID=UPI0034D4D289
MATETEALGANLHADTLIQTVYDDAVHHVIEIGSEIEQYLAGTGEPALEILQNYSSDLQGALQNLENTWLHYQSVLTRNPDLLGPKLRDYRAAGRNARKIRNDLSAKINEKTLSKVSDTGISPNKGNGALPLPRLPHIKIPDFDGKYQEWPAFWDLYSSVIHNRTDITSVLKFSILRSSLKGNAFRVIEGLSITNQNYDVAIQMLKETYLDSSRLTRSLLREFSNLPSPRHNYEELLNFRLAYRKLMLQASNNEVNVEQSESLLTNILLQKLSPETSKLLISKYQTFDLSLSQISEGLKYALDLFEYCKELSSHDSKSVGHNPLKVASIVSRSDSGKVGDRYKIISAGSQRSNSVNIQPKHKPCLFCNENHAAKYCSNYPSVESRRQKLRELSLCFLCLQPGHVVSNCKTQVKCRHCDGRHHTFLCFKLCNNKVLNPSKSMDRVNVQSQKSVKGDSVQSVSSSSVTTSDLGNNGSVSVQSSAVLPRYCSEGKLVSTAIPTATVQVSGGGTKLQTRTFFDTGSQRSFICPSLVQELNLKTLDRITLSLSPFGCDPVSVTCDLVKVVVRLGKSRISVKALVHNNVDTCIFTPGIAKVATFLRSKGVKLADHYLTSDNVNCIQLIIGVDYFHKFIHNQSSTMGICTFSTAGGALIYGPMPQWSYDQSMNIVATQHVICARVGVMDLCSECCSISNLWELDAIGIKEFDLSPEERRMVEQFEHSIHKVNNQYVVSLPFKSSCRPPTNYRIALGQLKSLMGKFISDPLLWHHYSSILSEYLNLGFIESVPPSEPIKGHYLPYHHVKKDSSTTPIRIVFNASFKRSGTYSLNECLLTGPSLTTKLFESLLAFRTNPWAVISDISKAFLRIGIDESSRDWCRFVWMTDTTDPSIIVSYRFKVVCFGATCSPFLLQSTLNYHFNNHSHPLAKSLMSCFYVDNFLCTYENVEQMLADYPVINHILEQAGMPLQEWVSNSAQFNEYICAEKLVNDKNGVTSVLGINWNIFSDVLNVKPCSVNDSSVTKRSILSCVASVFDPFGLVSPVVILGKILISDLWKLNLKWDEPVSPEIIERFNRVKEQLLTVSTIEFPRFAVSPGKCQLHIFCDSSQKAFGAVAYSVDLSSQTSNLLVSKARVCPQKKLTMPKLELTSVNIGCKLANTLMKISHLKFQSCFIWSDSEVTIARIRSDKCQDPYVRNRVKEIRDSAFPIMYVSSRENPADLLSRGCDIKVLLASSLWKYGPDWLISGDYPPQKEYLVDMSLNVSVNEIIAEPVNVMPPHNY